MPLTVDSVRLFNTQESRSQATGNVNTFSVIDDESDETLLAGFEVVERFPLAGFATANRAVSEGYAGSDAIDSLGSYVLTLESLCNNEQGTGYTMEDDERGRTGAGAANVVVDSVSWRYEAGATQQIDWYLSTYFANSIMSSTARSVDTSPSPRQVAELTDGSTTVQLGHVQDMLQTRFIEMEVFPYFDASPGENDVIPNSGVTREIEVTGRKMGTTAELTTFRDFIRDNIGSDTTVTFKEHFPGRDLTVMIKDFDDTFGAGQSRTMEYHLSMVEGVV